MRALCFAVACLCCLPVEGGGRCHQAVRRVVVKQQVVKRQVVERVLLAAPAPLKVAYPYYPVAPISYVSYNPAVQVQQALPQPVYQPLQQEHAANCCCCCCQPAAHAPLAPVPQPEPQAPQQPTPADPDPVPADPAEPPADPPQTPTTDIRGMLEANCFKCHSTTSGITKKGLNIEEMTWTLDGVEQSEKAIRGAIALEVGVAAMPPAPAEQLTDEQASALVAWARE